MVPQGLSRPREGGHSVASSTPKSRLQAGVERAREATKAGITSLLVLVGATGVAGQAKAQEVKPVVEITTDANNIDIRSFQVADNTAGGNKLVVQMANIQELPKAASISKSNIIPGLISFKDGFGAIPEGLRKVLTPGKDTYISALDGKDINSTVVLGVEVLGPENADKFLLNNVGLAKTVTLQQLFQDLLLPRLEKQKADLLAKGELSVEDKKELVRLEKGIEGAKQGLVVPGSYYEYIKIVFDESERGEWRRTIDKETGELRPLNPEELKGEVDNQIDTYKRYVGFIPRTLKQIEEGRLDPEALKVFIAKINEINKGILVKYQKMPIYKEVVIDASTLAIYGAVLDDEAIAKLPEEKRQEILKKREIAIAKYIEGNDKEGLRGGKTDDQLRAEYLKSINGQKRSMASDGLNQLATVATISLGEGAYGKIGKTAIQATDGKTYSSSALRYSIPSKELVASLPTLRGYDRIIDDGVSYVLGLDNINRFGKVVNENLEVLVDLNRSEIELADEKKFNELFHETDGLLNAYLKAPSKDKLPKMIANITELRQVRDRILTTPLRKGKEKLDQEGKDATLSLVKKLEGNLRIAGILTDKVSSVN